MGNDYGFKFRDNSSIWETDEKEIFKNTCRLGEELKTHEDGLNTYYNIVRMFKRGSQYDIANLLADLFKQQKKNEQQIDEYTKQVQELNKQVMDLLRELKTLSAELENVYAHGLGKKLKQAKEIKNLYKKGESLRKIGKIYQCDKSTVRRLLVNMGVTIRE